MATHQALQSHPTNSVLTYYLPLTTESSTLARQRLLNTPRSAWLNQIVAELSIPHPQLLESITQADLFRWGHADISDFSVFEEANYRGVNAAEAVLSAQRIRFYSSIH